MATKPKLSADEKFERQDLDIFEVLAALDQKDYGFYSRLSEEQRKKFVPYLITHWMSAVKANGVLGGYYVMSTNENANKHLFDERVQQHPELQWLMLCAASPGVGKQFHQWIPHLNAKISELRADATKKEVGDYFAKVYPKMDKQALGEIAEGYVASQRHMRRLAERYPEMKLTDIELLAELTTAEELDNYDRDSGK